MMLPHSNHYLIGCIHMRHWLTLLITTILMIGCRPTATENATNPRLTASTRYIRRTNAEAVIVFVPGLFGDAVSTWTNSTTHAYWPELIAHDPAFIDSDIYAFTNSARRIGTISEIVENLNLQLTSDEVFKAHKRVIFICHSVGAVIVRAYLLRYRNQATQVPLIFLLSPLSSGASIERSVKSLQGSAISDTSFDDANGYLASVEGEWRAANLPVVSRCLYESKATLGVMIVRPAELSSVCDGIPTPVDANHIEIARPASINDPPYVLFKKAFQEDAFKAEPPVKVFTSETITSEPLDFNLGCGEARNLQLTFRPARQLRPDEQIAIATPALRNVNNLKGVSLRLLSFDRSQATVALSAYGLDRDWTGNCRAGGHGQIVVTFVVNGAIEQR
jgi:hypothetical protein